MTIKDRIAYTDLMYRDLRESIEEFLTAEPSERSDSLVWLNYQNPDTGITVLKKKIVALRRELTKVSKELEGAKAVTLPEKSNTEKEI